MDAMLTHGACPECQHPVNDQGTGAWIHTLTQSYRCPGGTGGDWVGPAITEDAIEAAVDKAVALTEMELREIMFDEDEVREKIDEATLAGRTAMHAEMDTALSEAFDRVAVGPGATAADAEMILREALAIAWNSVAP